MLSHTATKKYTNSYSYTKIKIRISMVNQNKTDYTCHFYG